jgi:hypothetical protein
MSRSGIHALPANKNSLASHLIAALACFVVGVGFIFHAWLYERANRQSTGFQKSFDS